MLFPRRFIHTLQIGLLAMLGIMFASSVNDPFTGSKKSKDYISLFHSVTNDVTRQICQECQLTVVGGGGGMMDSIYEMAITFIANYPLSEDRAREILVLATESYLKKINAHQGLRIYLRNFPFTPHNLSISLINYSSNLGDCKPPIVDIAHFHCGKARFFSGAFERGQFEYKIEESYQEAKEKVAASKRAM